MLEIGQFFWHPEVRVSFIKNKIWADDGGKISINTDNWMAIRESVVIGHRARASANKSVAVGEQAFAASNSTSLGSEAIAYGNETVALGMQSYAEQTDDVALGHRAYAKGSLSTALGAHSAVEAQHSIAIGYQAHVGSQYIDSIALGYQSEVNETSNKDKMMEDKQTDHKMKTYISKELAEMVKDKLGGVLSIGKKDTKYRQIVNVAPGTEDTHAVNLGQLREAMKNAGGGGVNYFSVHKLTDEKTKTIWGLKQINHLLLVSQKQMRAKA